MFLPRRHGAPLDLSELEMGGDPRWAQAYEALDDLIAGGELDTLERLWRELGESDVLVSLAQRAWRGRVYCGQAGARAFLSSLARPPVFEVRTSTPELWGALLGHATHQGELAALVEGVEDVGAYVLGVAVQEHLLRDGELSEPALQGWRSPLGLPSRAHSWEQGILSQAEYFSHDTLGNFYMRQTSEPSWPEGGLVDRPAVSLVAYRQWGIDAEGDPQWPAAEPPPVGPFAAAALYPNAYTWCIETLVDNEDAFQLGAWPFPEEHLSLGEVRAEPVSARHLLRQWLWRGMVGGAYGKSRCAAVARRLAWTSLAALAGVAPELDTVDALRRIAAASEGLKVGGFRSRGPSVDMLGGDFGFVAQRPDGQAFAAAHTDSD